MGMAIGYFRQYWRVYWFLLVYGKDKIIGQIKFRHGAWIWYLSYIFYILVLHFMWGKLTISKNDNATSQCWLLIHVYLWKKKEFTLRPAHSPSEATNDNWESSNKLQKAVPRESQRKPQWCCQRTFQRLAILKKKDVWNLGGFELLDEFVLE